MTNSQERKVLQLANLDYAHRLDDIWEENPSSVEDLHAEIRNNLLFELENLGLSSKSRALRGPGGSGKTHLLGTLRQAISKAPAGTERASTTFVLVDMTDVSRVWHTILLGYLESLHKEMHGPGEGLQIDAVLKALFEPLGEPENWHARLREATAETFDPLMRELLGKLHKKFRAKVGHHKDVLRALCALGSEDFDLSDPGYSWLLGEPLEEESLALLGIKGREQDPKQILRGISWAISFRGPCLLCLDQIDAIVAQYAIYASKEKSSERFEEQQKAESIILNLASGLAGLQDETTRTLALISCLEMSFEVLQKAAVSSLMDRFSESFKIHNVPESRMARQMVARRMAPAFDKGGFTPPYDTWPFAPEAFEHIGGLYTPREILQFCQEHRGTCLQKGHVTELAQFGSGDLPSSLLPAASGKEEDSPRIRSFSHLDQRLGELEKTLDPAPCLEEEQEDDLGQLLRFGALLLLQEIPPQKRRNMDPQLDPLGSNPGDPLHVRIRLVFKSEGDREQHYCARVLQKSNPNAYRSRLDKALTASGIEKELSSFRKLTIFRNSPRIAGGAKTQQKNKDFDRAGGRFIPLQEKEILVLLALRYIKAEENPFFEEWIAKRRMVSQLSCMQSAFPWIHRFFPASSGKAASPLQKNAPAPPQKPEAETSPSDPEDVLPPKDLPFKGIQKSLFIGTDLLLGEPITLSPAALARHGVVFGGGGSGKAMLLKRLVEEAGLCGIPSVVVDSTGDLSLLGTPRKGTPSDWDEEMLHKAREFAPHTETLLWTPGLPGGRPLNLAPLPDFEALREDAPGIDSAITMATESLMEQLIKENSRENTKYRTVLTKALQLLVQRRKKTLRHLRDILHEAPQEIGTGIQDYKKLCGELEDLLRAREAASPLSQSKEEEIISPRELFGENPLGSTKTRISVINLSGLTAPQASRDFVGRLAMALFSRAKESPPENPLGLRGLLVLDEVREYIPSAQSSACKEILLRLAAQGRKYGIGLILASQNPRDVDCRALGQFKNWFLGRTQAPRSIEQCKELLREWGARNTDISRLQKGTFYMYTGTKPQEAVLPSSISAHPDGAPLPEEELLVMAKKERPRHER